MLRNFLSSVLSRSLSATSWQGLRISEKAPFLDGFSRPYSLKPLYKDTRRKSPDESSISSEAEKLGFLTKTGLQKNNFPDEHTPDLLFDGVPFKHLPIIVVKSHKNNTKLACHDHTGKLKTYRSAGVEGYKNAKKGTSIAAYVMSITFGRLTRKLGVTNVRLQVNGFGRGREAVLKGLKMSGINIISVTDTTAIPYCGPRPKKARRV